MDEFLLRSAIDYFTEQQCVFALDDILAFVEEYESKSFESCHQTAGLLFKLIAEDPRFISPYDQVVGKLLTISKRTLKTWYINLNLRLATGNLSRLRTDKLQKLMGSLLENGTWSALPNKFIAFGEELSLIAKGILQDEFLFPLACVISFVSPSGIGLAKHFLVDSLLDVNSSLTIPADLEGLMSNALNILTYRQKRVIQLRFGLIDMQFRTLEEIAQEFNLTRERIRQIEAKALKRINHPKNREPLLILLLSYILTNKGSLLVSSNTKPQVSFVAERLGIPVAQFPLTQLSLLGQAPFSLTEIKIIRSKTGDIEEIGKVLCEKCNVLLSRKDWMRIAEDLSQPLLESLRKTEKVYFALKQLNEASHYQKIHEMYCELFPKERPSVHSLHALLLREENGVVWVGERGKFSLEEWGDKRPLLSIHDAVADIVIKRYEETKKPVPLSTIQAEIGKYRKYVNQNSIIMAAGFNQHLEQISSNLFVPKKIEEKEESGSSDDEMDELLRNFEASNKRSQKNQ